MDRVNYAAGLVAPTNWGARLTHTQAQASSRASLRTLMPMTVSASAPAPARSFGLHGFRPPCHDGRSGLEMPMRVWRLLPIDPHAEVWQASTHKGPALVRAETAERARQLASARFTGGASTRSTAAAPWEDDGMVRAEVADEPRYPDHGPEGVLDPIGWDF
jgi:hypothetical protein